VRSARVAYSAYFATTKPAICVIAPQNPQTGESIRFWNSKLIRYAGYLEGGGVLGDPDEVERTDAFRNLGWKGKRQAFDLLPISYFKSALIFSLYPIWNYVYFAVLLNY